MYLLNLLAIPQALPPKSALLSLKLLNIFHLPVCIKTIMAWKKDILVKLQKLFQFAKH